MTDLAVRLEAILGAAPTAIRPLSGGSVGEVYRVDLPARAVVVKVDNRPAAQLDREGRMLAYLAGHTELPVPAVLHSTPELLIMAYVPGRSRFSAAAERDAAAQLAALHQASAPAFGFAEPTLIGGLDQPNPWTERWLDFFRDQRLLYMAAAARAGGRLPGAIYDRLERLAADLSRWLTEPERPALLHGDVWTTNVLADETRVTAFLDPAIYFGHPEIELAFTTLFGTFGPVFYEAYQAQCPLDPGFWEARRSLYNLYPLLVHVRLFGGSYVSSVTATLEQFGY